jgi:phosphatidylethanolamine/phosphatidyl-N-methylethanolamine N-methyltransferase
LLYRLVGVGKYRRRELLLNSNIDLVSVKRAYRRYALYYDAVFGIALGAGRRHAVAVVNSIPGSRVLEVGIGTGLSVADYNPDKQIIGIDISSDMLKKAQQRITGRALSNVVALLEMDAEQLAFADDSFDIVVAMYVASVTPSPDRFFGETKRVCRPGGDILIVNHFAADGGIRGRAERLLAPLSRWLGWRPDHTLKTLLSGHDERIEAMYDLPPFGLFSFVHIRNDK